MGWGEGREGREGREGDCAGTFRLWYDMTAFGLDDPPGRRHDPWDDCACTHAHARAPVCVCVCVCARARMLAPSRERRLLAPCPSAQLAPHPHQPPHRLPMQYFRHGTPPVNTTNIVS
jgi:hypothetical protein